MVQHALPNCRNCVEVRGSPTLDLVADQGGIGLRDQCDGRLGLERLEGDGPCTHVEQRIHAHRGAAWLELGARMRAQVVGPVRDHDALRLARAAAREEQRVRVAFGETGRVDIVGRRAGIDHRAEVEERHTESSGDDLAIDAVRVVDHQRCRAGQADHLGRLVYAEQRVGRSESRADLGQPHEQRHGVDVVEAPHHHAIAQTDTRRDEGVRVLATQTIELGVGDRAVTQRHRDGCRLRTGSGPEHLADQQVSHLLPLGRSAVPWSARAASPRAMIGNSISSIGAA
ncbi:unannotated protein [freshwater metagenome]|uniref:Unannotated protein n=1 Tax=freshwater metagenome TaxID=449393 RepID=A0A6J7NR10_9ZZZZ